LHGTFVLMPRSPKHDFDRVMHELANCLKESKVLREEIDDAQASAVYLRPVMDRRVLQRRVPNSRGGRRVSDPDRSPRS
jgi:hypothetical protein